MIPHPTQISNYYSIKIVKQWQDIYFLSYTIYILEIVLENESMGIFFVDPKRTQ